MMTTMTIEQALIQAVEAHKNSNLQEAEQLYRAILQNQPNQPDANHNLGILAVQTGHAHQALSYLKTALEANPSQGQFWIDYIDTLNRTGQIQAAKSVLEQGLTAGLKGEAVNRLREKLAANSEKNQGQNILEKAAALREAGEYEKSRDLLNDYLAKNSDDAEALAHLSHALLLLQEKDLAFEKIDRAVKINPELAIVQQNLSRVLLGRGEVQQAFAAAQKACAKDGQDHKNQLVLASCLGRGQKINEAMNLIDKVLAQQPDFAEALAQRSLLLQGQGRTKEAIADATRALELKPHIPGLYVFTAGLYKAVKDMEKALALLDAAIQLHPSDKKAYRQKAGLLAETDKLEAAVECYSELLKTEPDNMNIVSELGNIYSVMRENERAVSFLDKAIQADSAGIQGYFYQGQHFLRNGDLEGAEKFFQKVLTFPASPVEAYLQYSLIKAHKKDFSAALKLVEAGLKKFPNHSGLISTFSDFVSCMPKGYDLSASFWGRVHLRLAGIWEAFAQKTPEDKVVLDFVQNIRQELSALGVLDTIFPKSQIYRGKLVGSDCQADKAFFEHENMIAQECFGCYKVVLTFGGLIDCIRYFFRLDRYDARAPVRRKLMIDTREGCNGVLKGFYYTRNWEEAHRISKHLQEVMAENCTMNFQVSVKRGCSEFQDAHPDYNALDEKGNLVMRCPDNWKHREKEYFQHRNFQYPVVQGKYENLGLTIQDAYVLCNWIAIRNACGHDDFSTDRVLSVKLQQEEDVIKKAAALREAGEYEKSRDLLNDYLAKNPDDAEALAHLAHAHLLLQEKDLAFEKIDRAVKINPELAIVQQNLSRILLGRGEVQQAFAAAQKACAKEGQDHKNQLVLASCLGRGQKINEAMNLIDRVLAQQPDFAEALAQRAVFLQGQGRTKEAIADATRALELKPHIPGLFSFAARLYSADGDVENAVAAMKRALDITPDHVENMIFLGQLLRQNKALEEAQTVLEKAVRLAPQEARIWTELGVALFENKNEEEAKSAYLKALELAPDMLAALTNLGTLLVRQQLYGAALHFFEKAYAIAPDKAHVQINMATGLFYMDRFAQAENLVRKALQSDENILEGQMILGMILLATDRKQEASEVFEDIIAKCPGEDRVLLTIAEVYIDFGDMQTAEKYARAALHNEDCLVGACNLLTKVLRFTSKEPEFEKLETLMEQDSTSAEDKIRGHFSLGRMYADLGEHDKAFSHYECGNHFRIQHYNERYEPKNDQHKLEMARNIFLPEFFARRADWGSSSPRPIFILGMTRSGTTLLEQILGTHTQVYPAGELTFLRQELASHKKLLAPERIMDLGQTLTLEDAKHIADKYLEKIAQVDENTPRFTDKMPHNFELLWLIALIFPRATIIHSLRNPIDTCVSNYFQSFKPGFHAHKNTLRSMGQHYVYYRKLMEHWKQVLPCQIHDMVYEDVVADTEGQVRKLLAACNLEYEPACLEFHQTQRTVRTASVWQVRQKIYSSSVEKWRRYEKHLGPLLEALGPYAK